MKILMIFVISLTLKLITISLSYENIKTDYCLVGAGPASLQLGYFLQQANRNYIIFERNNMSGSFFKKYPRHRTLISINKRSTGRKNREFNERHDWNSLISHELKLLFAHYSKDFFPSADELIKYLNDYQQILNINVKFNTDIINIKKNKDTGLFSMENKQNKQVYVCKWVIVATGLWLPNNPQFSGFKYVKTYEDVSINPNNFVGHRVLILGRGNSAFETANNIYGVTSSIHMIGRTRARLAWSTHYVGDLRAINNNILDTYQLKSLDGLLEASTAGMIVDKINGKLWVKFNDSEDMRIASNSDNYALREGYDDIISCLGFKFDTSLFHNSSLPVMSKNVGKYPGIKNNYESENIPGLYFAGTITHSLDYRKSSGGFIHGFRYTARALHRLLEWKNHEKRWPCRTYRITQLVDIIITRINEAAGPYQMFGYLVDVIVFTNNNTLFTLVPEYPATLLTNFEAMTGIKAPEGILISLLDYGPDFSGPGKDTFKSNRATGDPLEAHKSNFLHPIFYFYETLPNNETSMIKLKGGTLLLPRPNKIHHILEDFLTQWTAPITHVLPLSRFLESCINTDLRDFSIESCFLAELTSKITPITCHKYRYDHNNGITFH